MKVRELIKTLKRADPNLEIIVVTAAPMVREVEWKIGWQKPIVTDKSNYIVVTEISEVHVGQGPDAEGKLDEKSKHLYFFC